MNVVSDIDVDRIIGLGQEAALKGIAVSSPPYQAHSQQRDCWRAGWYQALTQLQSQTPTPLTQTSRAL